MFQLSSEWSNQSDDNGHLFSHVTVNRNGKLIAAAMDNNINIFNLSQGNIIVFNLPLEYQLLKEKQGKEPSGYRYMTLCL